jgi:ABC-type sugar transport system ATPase subunit
MKILIGNVQPDQGSYRIRGQAVRLRDPAHAIRLGVGMVFQEGSLIPNLSIMENLFLCHETEFEKLGVLSKRAMLEAARTALAPVKVAEDLDIPIGRRERGQSRNEPITGKAFNDPFTANGDRAAIRFFQSGDTAA